MKTFDIEPRVAGKVHLGSDKRESVILAGRMAEKGNGDPIYFDGSDNFVVFEVGKRGSGKSYGMGSLLEGFATAAASKIGVHSDRRAVVLLDPLDIHWTALIPLSADGPEGLRRQHAVLKKWPDLEIEPINVQYSFLRATVGKSIQSCSASLESPSARFTPVIGDADKSRLDYRAAWTTDRRVVPEGDRNSGTRENSHKQVAPKSSYTISISSTASNTTRK
ncbi:MAG: hypothetical protein IPH55_06625 [Betaproteobacteria bacterium]|nr:hypothetical protein [Betaproteobacteria bacterium]